MSRRHYTKKWLRRLNDAMKYDPAIGVITWKIASGRVKLGARAGNVAADGYRHIRIQRKLICAARVAWYLTYKRMPASGYEIDHINGIRDDDRIANLRLAKPWQNRLNSCSRNGSTSKFKGVSFAKNTQKWVMAVHGNGVSVHKLYDSEVAAAKAYDVLARKHFGCFARLNFPTE